MLVNMRGVLKDDGSVSFSFDVVPARTESTLKETLAFLESRKVEPVICNRGLA